MGDELGKLRKKPRQMKTLGERNGINADDLLGAVTPDDGVTRPAQSPQPKVVEKIIEKEVLPDEAIVPLEDGSIIAKGYTLTRVGLIAHDDATSEDWRNVGELLLRLEGVIQLLIGDWLVHGENTWGQTYDEMMAITQYSYSSLSNFKWVASNVKFSLRRENLTFTHYSYAAKIKDENLKAELLEQAARDNLSVAAFRELIKERIPKAKTAIRDSLGARDYRTYSKNLANIATRLSNGRKLSSEQINEAFSQIDEARRFLELLEATIGNLDG